MHKIKLYIIGLLGLLGTIDAAYLTNEAFKIKNSVKVFGQPDNLGFVCDVNTTFSCSSVFKEDFAWIFGLPFSGIALAVYPIFIIITILALTGRIKNSFKLTLIMAILGIIYNGYIIINEFILGSYCLLCLGCTAIIILIGILSIFGLKNKNDK